jgi:UDP-2-acetamido-3-amino-2,3-dideoxy-glucuronate N-acetyltransferase
MMTTVSALRRSDLAPNLLVGEGVAFAENVEIGANVILHDAVSLGPGVHLDDGVVLGRVPVLGRRSRNPPPAPGPTTVEAGAIICTHAIVDAGAQIGPHAFLGDRASLRAGARIHVDASIGSATAVGRGAQVGERARTQNNCLIGPGVVVEADAFLGPGVKVLTGRRMAGSRRPPPLLRRGCQVGAGVVIMPGVEIGEKAVVGAGAVVLADVPASTVVAGVPARAQAALAAAGQS